MERKKHLLSDSFVKERVRDRETRSFVGKIHTNTHIRRLTWLWADFLNLTIQSWTSLCNQGSSSRWPQDPAIITKETLEQFLLSVNFKPIVSQQGKETLKRLLEILSHSACTQTLQPSHLTCVNTKQKHINLIAKEICKKLKREESTRLVMCRHSYPFTAVWVTSNLFANTTVLFQSQRLGKRKQKISPSKEKRVYTAWS